MWGKVADKLDHPVMFVLFAMFAIAGASSILYYLFKSAGLQGAATALRHP